METKKIFALAWAVGAIATLVSAIDGIFSNFFGVVFISVLFGTITAMVSTGIYLFAQRFFPEETKKYIAYLKEDE